MEFTPDADRRAMRLGTLIIAIIVVGMTALIVLGAHQWKAMRTWSVVGEVERGAGGLRPGSPVRVGGVIMGSVVSITMTPRSPGAGFLTREERGDHPSGTVEIVFTLDAEVELRSSAIIVHDVNPLSGQGELDILNVGSIRTPALPGRVGHGATLTPLQPKGRPFFLARRKGAFESILGSEGADHLRSTITNLEAVQRVILGSAADGVAPGDPAAHHASGLWADLLEAMKEASSAVRADMEPWSERMESMRAAYRQIQSRIEATEGDPSGLVHRISQLGDEFGADSGLRALGRELAPLFSSFGEAGDDIVACFTSAFAQARLIGWVARALWPEVKNDLLITKTGFAITGSELWRTTGPEMFTTLVRIFQPPSARDRAGLDLILSANAVALSAADLQAAVQSADAALIRSGGQITPAIRRQLEREVVPAMARYRRDLERMLRVLDRAALRS
ncbi:MAG: hypothetical protein KF724_07195 [Phycisphaeraceae bacterium]|nr:hypothetical protein [Phycisphaeraceae bacterium]